MGEFHTDIHAILGTAGSKSPNRQKVFPAFSAKTTNTLEIRAMIPDLGNQVVES
jgi:pyoverdine/dityrosine biosynthesis protein Dit1